MTVIIEIHYESAGNRSYRKAQGPLKGKTREQAAYNFWRWIQRKAPFGATLVQVICDGKDITDVVRELEITERKRIEEISNNLPF